MTGKGTSPVFDFSKMSEAMAGLSALDELLHDIRHELRVGNAMTAMRLAVIVHDGSNVNGVLETAEQMVAIREANDRLDRSEST